MRKKDWGFDTRNIDRSVRPQDDFFKYANGGWFKRTQMPAEESRWGTFLILRKRTELEVKRIVESLMGKRAVRGSEDQQIRDFYRSGMDMERRNALGAKPLMPYLRRIAALEDRRGLAELIPRLHRDGIDVLWSAMVGEDEKDADWNILHLAQGGLGLPERDYYLVRKPEQERVRRAYRTHIARLFRLAGEDGRTATHKANLVMRVETRLARASMKMHDMRDPKKTYHKMPLKKLAKIAPALSWPRYLRALGMKPPRSVNVMQPAFMSAASAMLEHMPLEAWRAYLSWHVIAAASSFLSEPFVEANFDFYGRVLTGATKMKPLWRRSLAMTNAALGEAVGKRYVAHYFPPASKRLINELVENVFAAYEERLKNLDWMSPVAKKRALAKLHTMTRKVGYPDTWKSYRDLLIKPDDYFGNAVRSARYEHRRNARKLGRRVDRGEWYMTPQTVNAYYNPTVNEIAFPAAILQPPYFGLRQDPAINYGAIGGVIGHEITHGFDDQGSQFDLRGNLKNWWTKTDRRRFERKARVLERQFNRYALHGVQVNGKLTLGENIADLGGYAIALDAYKRHLEQAGAEELLDGYTPLQRFFLGAAQDWRQLSRPEVEKTIMLSDPHAPAVFRINGPASNLPEFYEAFGVKRGDKLYRAPKERAKIW